MRRSTAIGACALLMAAVCHSQATPRNISNIDEFVKWHNEVFTSSTTVIANIRLTGNIEFNETTSALAPLGHTHKTPRSAEYLTATGTASAALL